MSSSQDSSDWTRVVRKGRKNRRNNTESHSSRHAKPQTEGLRSPEDLEKDYRQHRKRWEEEAYSCPRLRELVTAKASHLTEIDKAVHLGVGTFDPNDGLNLDGKRSTFAQLAAFEIMVEELEKITSGKVEKFFQDPAFNASDKKFLENIGHTVLDDPKGTQMVDEKTLLFGVHLYRPVYNDALKGELPALFVGTGWEDWGDIFADEHIENVERMHKAYERCDFPQERLDCSSLPFQFSSSSTPTQTFFLTKAIILKINISNLTTTNIVAHLHFEDLELSINYIKSATNILQF
ncbi:SRR1-like domain [Fusarium oxysporum f. sp. vasinfectum]|nr:SRR1-like domain [Fusarium oxysporum f. sp. vasinfectum]KAK2929368.1 SRR1-like domain [Fusarium oxysporum f. sp. vasinfectum]